MRLKTIDFISDSWYNNYMKQELQPGTKVFHKNLKVHGTALSHKAMAPNHMNSAIFVEFKESSIEVGDIREFTTALLAIIED